MPECPQYLIDQAFLGEKQETDEADYLIVTLASRVKFVLDQLEDLHLIEMTKKIPDSIKREHGTNHPPWVKVYYITDNGQEKCLISIKLPQRKIDEKASREKLECAILNLEVEHGVQMPFKNTKKMKQHFSSFGAVVYCEAVEEILKDQINFDEL